MNKTYKSRMIVSGALLLLSALVLLKALSIPPDQGAKYASLFFFIALIFGVMIGKSILQAFANASGMDVFMSGGGLIFYYMVVMVMSPVLSPLYFLWNTFKYVTTKDR